MNLPTNNTDFSILRIAFHENKIPKMKLIIF